MQHRSVRTSRSNPRRPKNYIIAPGPLGNVLAQFAALAGVQLSFDAALATVQSPGLNGVYTVQSGFAQLLRNTGHELVDLKDGSFTVRKSAPLQASSLPHVLVSAAAGKEDVNGPVNGLLARRSATGTKPIPPSSTFHSRFQWSPATDGRTKSAHHPGCTGLQCRPDDRYFGQEPAVRSTP